MKIQQLKQEIEQVQAELHAENQKGNHKDGHKVAGLETKLAELSQQFVHQQQLEENEQVHEQRVEESHINIAHTLDNLVISGVTVRELFLNETREGAEAAYQAFQIAYKQMMMDQQEGFLKEIKSYKDQLATAKVESEAHIKEQQKKYDDLYEESAKQRFEASAKVHELENALEEMGRKRDAAVTRAEEAEAEVKRLESQVDDLRKEIAVGPRRSVEVVEIGSDAAIEAWKRQRELIEEKKRAEQDSKILIYNVQPLDSKGAQFSAQLAENDKVITYSWVESKKYREVTAEEAEQFRRSTEKSNGETVETPGESVEESLVPVNLQFQEDETDDAAEHGLDESDTDGEVEAEATGSVEERLTALEKRVAELEGQTKGEAA